MQKKKTQFWSGSLRGWFCCQISIFLPFYISLCNFRIFQSFFFQ